VGWGVKRLSFKWDGGSKVESGIVTEDERALLAPENAIEALRTAKVKSFLKHVYHSKCGSSWVRIQLRLPWVNIRIAGSNNTEVPVHVNGNFFHGFAQICVRTKFVFAQNLCSHKICVRTNSISAKHPCTPSTVIAIGRPRIMVDQTMKNTLQWLQVSYSVAGIQFYDHSRAATLRIFEAFKWSPLKMATICPRWDTCTCSHLHELLSFHFS
jgi:hypothetical protein